MVQHTPWLTEQILENQVVRLEPLTPAHADGLIAAATDGELWNLWFTSVPRPEHMSAYIDEALSQHRAGSALPFTVIDKSSGKIVGSTRICNAESTNQRVEIGYTWYAKSQQKSAINSNCKLLLLQHAFERLECIAVELRTHWHNHNSRAAIAKLGAKQDGVLRNHIIDKNGIKRDTVVFSIINEEWQAVKFALEQRIARLTKS